jgi:hypothetical protein
MTPIRSLQPKVGVQEATRIFAPSGPRGLLLRLRQGPLLAVADIYLPFRLYRVVVDDEQVSKTSWYAVDALSGVLDVYEFPRDPAGTGIVELTVEPRNCPCSRISEHDTRHRAMDAVRRKIFSTGFFRIRKPQISAELLDSALHVPYWAAFYGSKDCVQTAVLDAVRGRLEGGKARHVIESWLHAPLLE